MTVEYVYFLVEEPSMEAFLRELLPRTLEDVPFSIHSFQCKDELMGRLPERLRGYAAWLPENYRVVVVVDRDDDDCRELKQQLEQCAIEAGLATRSRRNQEHFTVINRIVVEELESWYFGDWQAVRTAYPRVSSTVTSRASFRNPDSIAGGTWEAFERVLQGAGYFRTGLRKIEAARAIAPHLDPARNRSHSFQVLRQALLEIASTG
jgi:hypothetical protein